MKKKLTKSFDFNSLNFIFQPTLGASVSVGEYARLMAFYFNQQSIPTTDQFTTNFVQTGYRDFQNNAGTFYIPKNNTWQIFYDNTNWSKLYAANVGISFNQNYFYNSSEFTFSNLLNTSTNRPIEVTLNQLSANWQIDRLISVVSTKIRFEGNLGQSEILNRVNGSNLLPNKSQYLDAKVYLISAFKGIFNFQFGSRYRISRVRQFNDKDLTPKTVLFAPNTTLLFKPLQGLSIKINIEQLNWYNENSHDMTNLLDADILYRRQKSPWTFSLQGNNLLNTKYIYFTNVTNFSILQSNYSLQPRWFTAGTSFSF